MTTVFAAWYLSYAACVYLGLVRSDHWSSDFWTRTLTGGGTADGRLFCGWTVDDFAFAPDDCGVLVHDSDSMGDSDANLDERRGGFDTTCGLGTLCSRWVLVGAATIPSCAGSGVDRRSHFISRLANRRRGGEVLNPGASALGGVVLEGTPTAPGRPGGNGRTVRLASGESWPCAGWAVSLWGDTIHSALEVFGGIWLIVPLLAAGPSVAEERKLGTMDAHLCQPISRRAQCAVKLIFVLVLGGPVKRGAALDGGRNWKRCWGRLRPA